MSYDYEKEKAYCSTPEGQENLLRVWDRAQRAFTECGAIQAGKLIAAASACSNWSQMAVVDRLVEMGRMVYLSTDCWWQHRILAPKDWNQY